MARRYVWLESRLHPWNTHQEEELLKLAAARGPSEEWERNSVTQVWSQIKLYSAYLLNVDLQKTNMSKATIYWSNVSGSDLRHVNLRGAELRGTNLAGSNMYGADLSGASLYEVNFSNCHLAEANFDGAILDRSNFGNVNLSDARNLHKVRHNGPSIIGVDTLYKSGGNIPHEFLERCGVPDVFIRNMDKFIPEDAALYQSCFISYSHTDEEFVDYLYTQMREKGLNVWRSKTDVQFDRKLHEQISDAINQYDRTIVVLSENSINSNWVETEILRARQREREEGRRVLFPIRLMSIEQLKRWQLFDADEGRDLAYEMRKYHIADFSNWRDHANFQSLLEQLMESLRTPWLP